MWVVRRIGLRKIERLSDVDCNNMSKNYRDGYSVKIKHKDIYSKLYSHCLVLYVSVGQAVKQGQVIADCGSTIYSTSPHCHFEVI